MISRCATTRRGRISTKSPAQEAGYAFDTVEVWSGSQLFRVAATPFGPRDLNRRHSDPCWTRGGNAAASSWQVASNWPPRSLIPLHAGPSHATRGGTGR
jgi:hypothetical protein